MHEVITISVSQRANHLATQFFNCRETLLYDNTKDKVNDPKIFLNPTIDRISKTVSYSPRALLWDAKTGNGSLGSYQYSDGSDYYFKNDDDKPSDGDLIQTHPVIPKSDYQRALDAGLPEPKLNNSNTKYWSDYARLIYQPSSFNILRDWYHDTDNPNRPDFKSLKDRRFDKFIIGEEEFKSNYLVDFFDTNLHHELEQCDTLQGFNIITDIDNGWGGFSSALLVELRNELPKNTYFSWAFHESDPYTVSYTRNTKAQFNKKTAEQISNKIRATTSLSQESDLFIPVYSDPEYSNWEIGSLVCPLFDGLNSVLDGTDTEKRRNMQFLSELLQNGDNNRKIISSANMIKKDRIIDYLYYSRFPTQSRKSSSAVSEFHVFSKCNISRSNKEMKDNAEIKDVTNKQINTYGYKFADTVSDQFKEDSNYELCLTSDERCRNVFKEYGDFVSKYIKYDDDREDMKNSLENTASAYEFGWYDDSDSGDDNY
ncbi:Misato Segment II tubulin-like domain [Nakaseomyces glabratus]|nr:Misato Segment II tubulin-like domain [Nakaseomyces glabratus]KAH7594611.1 Misato Segment II tubulin-like domain [Nakaseomyces glabratus]